MRHSNPKGDFGVIVERALDLLIPRLERERFGKTLEPRKPGAPPPDTTSDDIPAAVRHAVAERDGYECTFCDSEGHRCGSRDFVHQGFKKKHVIEAVETVVPEMEPAAQRSTKAVYLKALAFLT